MAERVDGFDDIDNAAAFHRHLESLVAAAVANEVDVGGSWPIRDGDSGRAAWELQITPLSVDRQR